MPRAERARGRFSLSGLVPAITKSLTMRFSGYGGQQSSNGYYGNSFGWLWPWLPGSKYDYAKEAGDLWLNSAVMSCIAWMQRNFVDAELCVLEDDEDSDQVSYIFDDPLVQLVENPNPAYSGIDLWFGTLLSWVTDGNAYWMKARGNNGFGIPKQLWYVPHWMLAPQWPEDGSKFISHYLYEVNGKQVSVDVDDVIHFRYGLDPMNGRRGLSPLAAVLREICTDNEINNYSASLMRNMGIPGLVISPKDANVVIPFGEEQKINARFEAAFTGDDKGKPLVNTIPIDIQMPGFNPDQMAIDIMRKVPEERIAAAIGLPAGVVGLGAGLDRNTFNNYKEARQAAFENNIAPTQKLFALALERQLRRDFPEDTDPGKAFNDKPKPTGDPAGEGTPKPKRRRVGWDYRRVRVLQPDEKEKAERFALLFEKDLLKRAEARKEMGFNSDTKDEIYFSDVERKTKVDVAKNTPAPVMGPGGGGGGASQSAGPNSGGKPTKKEHDMGDEE